VRADLRPFFEEAHGKLALVLGGELSEADRPGEACGAAADDHDVVLHRLPLG